MSWLLVLIRGYQRLLSPWLGPHCRFYPTCSDYALEALQRFGIVRGGWLASQRLLKCHPLSPGGDDAVPPHPSSH
jgi:uncharacterized protein